MFSVFCYPSYQGHILQSKTRKLEACWNQQVVVTPDFFWPSKFLCSSHFHKCDYLLRDTSSAKLQNIFHLVVCLFVSFQDLGELQEAKQLLIQQKLELQGQVEATQGALEQEQKEHKATRESRNQREEQLFAQNQEVQDKLVNCLVPTE